MPSMVVVPLKPDNAKNAMATKPTKSSRKAFRGDATHSLPKDMREPYRLWFEFLKTALRDPKISVDRAIYADWGDVEHVDFKSWWDSHWRDLFAVPSKSVAVLHSTEEFQSTVADPSYLVVKVPVPFQAKLRDKELHLAIKNELQSNPKPKPAKLKPRFVITANRSMRRDVLRAMLRFYQLNLAHDRNPEATAVAYYQWAKAWNDKILAKNWKREKTFVPPFLRNFVEAVEAVVSAKSADAKRFARRSTGYDVLRGKVRRYIRQAEKIARNTGRGVFPGKFE